MIKMIKVLYKKPNEEPCEMEVENKLKAFQELVGGYIETIPANEDGTIIMIMNEEGKLQNLEPNIWLPKDCIVGNVIFVQNKFDGEFHSLTEDMKKAIFNMLK